MKNRLLLLLLFAMWPAVWAQDQMVRGKVVSQTNPVEGVLVVNINKEKEVKADKQGFFSINAQVGDTISVTDFRINPFKFTVTEENFKNVQIIEVTIISYYELEEIIIEKDKALTSDGLGIIPEGTPRYTPAERKWIGGGDLVPKLQQGIAVNFDALLNTFNGRSKELKRDIETEKKQELTEAIHRIFTADEITVEYGIPPEYVNGFAFYCAEDKEFTASVKAGNETHAKFQMSRLAIKYLTLIKEDDNKD